MSSESSHEEPYRPLVERSERQRMESRLQAKDDITRILADATDVAEAAPQILAAVCQTLGWDIGAIWQHDAAARTMSCVHAWSVPDLVAPEFLALTRGASQPEGSGLAGAVLATNETIWIDDV
ncbi:MAG: hypothetical protein ABIT01_10940, partial [Thermoanaerobaculia bacterium]